MLPMRETDPSINNRTLNRSTPQAAPRRTTRKNPLRSGVAPTAAPLPKLQQFLPLQPPFSAFGSITQFRDAQCMASVIAHSSIVPENYRGDEHLGDCIIALEIANRIGAPILAVMQNLRFVEGKPAWSSQFLISCVNATKRFSPIRFKMTGTRGEDSWGCIAWAVDKAGELLESPEVTLKMAKEEGWYHRPGSKWTTIPELMLRYRSATLFTRLYAPEITMGIQTTEEVVEMGPLGNAQCSRPIFEPEPAKPKMALKSQAQPGEVAPIHSCAPARSQRDKPAENPLPESAATAPESHKSQRNHLKALTGLIGLSNHSEAEVMKLLRSTGKCDVGLNKLAEVMDKQPDAISWAHDNWHAVDRKLTKLKEVFGL
jgi:hypothetical protein